MVWGDFQGILLSGKNKLQKSIYRMLYFVKEKKKNVCVYLLTVAKRNTGRKKQKLMTMGT